VAIVLAVIVVIGFAGFFLPYRTVTNDVAEQNQRKNLTEQNRALLQKILSTLRLLKDVKAQVSRLEAKQSGVISLSGSEARSPTRDTTPRVDFSTLRSDELLNHIEEIEGQFARFRALSQDSTHIFDSIPVLAPVTGPSSVSRGYGVALDPFSGKRRQHSGIDFVAEPGSPVIATASGTIQRVENHPIWGKKVVIVHSSSYTTGYSHLGEVKVSQGKRVRRGDVIGLIGLSGLSSGPHVHYEVWQNGQNDDPEKYFFPNDLVSR
jgi:murein DD-endopeptidase MepM/ murein hydrolase activator NlpD